VYSQIIAEQEAKSFIECVDGQSTAPTSVYCIPHHAVEKDSTTTLIHIVFDCRCRQSSKHPSLNDCLILGSPCDNDLCALLVHFRLHFFGLSTDIKKAFLHVQLHPKDRDYTRFFWPTDLSSPLCIYCFKVVPFGATSSPFMLHAMLQHHLKQYNSPVSRDMLSNLYVDNIISGCETEQAAVAFYRQARTIMCEGRLNLRSRSSNSTELMTAATKDNTAEGALSVNVLGLHWNLTSDQLHLTEKLSILTYDHLVTKREVLQDFSKVFDPLGFVAPVII